MRVARASSHHALVASRGWQSGPPRRPPGWRSCPCRWPTPARRRCATGTSPRRGAARRRPPGDFTTAQRAAPPRARASVSPTQTMGVSPARSAASSFSATISSVSPKCCRRSLCPRMTQVHPASLSIGALISPVNAPWSFAWHVLRRRWPRGSRGTRAAHAASAVNGGAITISTCSRLARELHALRRELDARRAAVVHLPVSGDERRRGVAW